MIHITIFSTSFLYAPGFFSYLKVMYQTQPETAVIILMDLAKGKLNSEGAKALLSGEIKTVEIEENLFFQIDRKYTNVPEVPTDE